MNIKETKYDDEDSQLRTRVDSLNYQEEPISIESAIAELDSTIMTLKETTSDLLRAKADTEQLIRALNDDSGSWLADHIIRPDNPKRKKEAIASLETLKTNLDKSIVLSMKAKDENLPELRMMANTVKTWPQYFIDLEPIINTNLTLAEPIKDMNIIDTIQFIVGVFVGGSWKLFGWAKKAKFSFTKGYLVAYLIAGFIGAIFSAESRKHEFEEIKKNADEANKEIIDLIDNLQEINNQVDLKFTQTNTILEEAEFVRPGTLNSHFQTLNALEKATIIIKDWAASYGVMLVKINRGRNPKTTAFDTAEDIVLKEEQVLGVVFMNEDERIEVIQKVFYLTYLIDWNEGGPGYLKLKECIESSGSQEEKLQCITSTINEIGVEVGISEEQTNFVLIRALLILNLDPAEIINIVEAIGVLSRIEIEEKIAVFEEFKDVA